MTAVTPLVQTHTYDLPPECQFVSDCVQAGKCLGVPKCRRNLVDAAHQVSDAIYDIRRHPDTFVRWPWGALDYMTNGMGKGEVWFAVAFSGIGKTTFVSSATNRWLDVGKKVFVLPLETQPKRFRTYLACQKLGIKPGDAFSGELRGRNDPSLPALEAELYSHAKKPLQDQLRVTSVPAISLATFKDACVDAADFGADILIVDHIDHIAAGDGTNLYAESVKVNRAAVTYAQEYNLLLVLTSQLNTDAVKGQDHLAKFAAPREQHVKFGGHKREIATGMLGLFRPLRAPSDSETPKDFAATVKKARAGEIEPHRVLQPHTMGVVYMKDRNYGTDGRKVMLSVVNGRVQDRDERDYVRYGI